jgi:hypothetical protein
VAGRGRVRAGQPHVQRHEARLETERHKPTHASRSC